MKRTLPILLTFTVAAALPAHAQSAGESRSRAAQAALSERYTQLWSQLPMAERAEFARRERHWLHVTRWDERQRCVEAHPGALAPAARAELAAHCLAQVTLRRLNELSPAALAVAH